MTANSTGRRRLAVLGSTGSVGRQALEVARSHRDKIEVVALAAGSDAELLAAQARESGARDVALAAPIPLPPPDLPPGTRVSAGPEEVEALLERTRPDIVLNAITGAAGLRPSVRALQLGCDLALANKESVVMAGPILLDEARRGGGRILPVDSEHSAIRQCLRAGRAEEVRRIVLTASGGPFRGADRERLSRVTPEEALRHPTWDMGPKISIDSATLMNKGLEIIEAHHLFSVPPDRIEVVVHPQSTVHSVVEFRDGSLIGHLGSPDMRIPILNALSDPERWEGPTAPFSLLQAGTLEFEEPDHELFPSLRMAYRACRRGGTLPAVPNAANEAAVHRFLAGGISFLAIFELVERALEETPPEPLEGLEQVLRIDRATRDRIERWTS